MSCVDPSGDALIPWENIIPHLQDHCRVSKNGRKTPLTPCNWGHLAFTAVLCCVVTPLRPGTEVMRQSLFLWGLSFASEM